MSISLIFPCHNEERAIPQVLPQAISIQRELLEQKKVKDFEILIVNDGSTDRSLEKLKPYSKEIQIIKLAQREGYGSALKKGIKKAKGDWIAFCDLDNSCDPKELELLVNLSRASSQPIVWGNRLNKKSQMPKIRKIGNELYRMAFLCLSFRLVFDACSGFRLFKKQTFIPQLYAFPNDLSFSIALTAYCVRKQIPFSTVPISYKKRLGKSKLHAFKDGWIFLFQLINFLFFKK